MIDVSLKLLSYSYDTDEIGNEIKTQFEKEVLIIRHESIGQNEFYNANQQNLKPNLKLIISSLNYNAETDIIYANEHYTVLRSQIINTDEVVLVCERRVGDV